MNRKILPTIATILLLAICSNISSANTPIWQHNVGSPIDTTPVLSSGNIYFGSSDGTFHAFNLNGVEIWNITLDSSVKSDASISDNIYVGTETTLYALSSSGNIIWQYPLQEHDGAYVASIVQDDNSVYFGYYDTLYSIKKDGTPNWNRGIGSSIVTSAPVLHNNDIYICNGNKVYIFSTSGDLIRTYEAPSTDRIYSSPFVDSDDIIYFGSGDGNVYSVYLNNTLKWIYHTDSSIWYSTPAISRDNDIIYIGSLDGNLHAIYKNVQISPTIYTYTNNEDAYLSVASSTYLDLRFMKSVTVNRTLTGTMTASFILRSDEIDPFVHAHARIYKNGSDVKTQIGNEYSTKYYNKDEVFTLVSDVSVNSGDTIEIWAWHDVSSNRTQWAKVSDMKITISNVPLISNGTSYWKYNTGYNIESSSIVDSDGNVYFGGDDNNIHVLTPDGNLLWDYTTGGNIRSKISVYNDKVFVTSTDGNIYAFYKNPNTQHPTELDSFRAVCMRDINVICDQVILNSYGENGTLKTIWYNLTKPEKKNIGIKLYEYLNSNVFYTTYFNTVCYDPNCNDSKIAWCLGNGMIRLMRFITPEEGKTFSSCYYKNGHQEIISYYYEKSYGLVAYPVDVVSEQNNFYHTISALQIGNNISNFDNWLFFQYGTSDITPGSWNMPLPARVTIRHFFPGECTSYGDYGSPVASWNIPEPALTATPTPVITSSGGGSSGSGGSSSSGGGGSPSEPYKNVNKTYKLEKYIYKNIPTLYNFSKSGMIISEIEINSDVNIPETEIKVEELKNISLIFNTTSLENSKYFNIWINTARFKNSTIKYKCLEETVVYIWNSTQWSPLSTTKLTNEICKVTTDKLSTIFAMQEGRKSYRDISLPSHVVTSIKSNIVNNNNIATNKDISTQKGLITNIVGWLKSLWKK